MIPCPCQVLEGIGQGRCPGSRGQGRHAAFQLRHSLFKYIQGRIGQPAVDIACIAEVKAGLCMAAVIKHVGRCLVNRNRPGAGGRIRMFLSCMKLCCLKSEMSVFSSKFFFHDLSSIPFLLFL